eukprot:c25313_g1_i1.p1 GENE.c25313_g1_i1~~c25313_g1_i1.p1  ORF type:complete len:193 (+),score=9.23 c25313_g1_i1:27-581(+)
MAASWRWPSQDAIAESIEYQHRLDRAAGPASTARSGRASVQSGEWTLARRPDGRVPTPTHVFPDRPFVAATRPLFSFDVNDDDTGRVRYYETAVGKTASMAAVEERARIAALPRNEYAGDVVYDVYRPIPTRSVPIRLRTGRGLATPRPVDAPIRHGTYDYVTRTTAKRHDPQGLYNYDVAQIR